MSSLHDIVNGRYRLEQLLGRGGMSDVYRAFDLVEERDVALKIVRSGDPEYVRRLVSEVRALEGFSHHGLIRLLDAGGDGDETYLVMEYVDGVTLSELLRAGALEPSDVARLGASLADALAYVHERGVVHRDVKPSNILRANDQSVRLGDFGIAQIHDATSHTVAGTAMGTVVYMAPEQLNGRDVGPRADVWSLGLVLLECLTGERAYTGSPSEIMARRLSGPVVLPADLPTPWRVVLMGMLDESPERRLDARQVAAMLASPALGERWLRTDSDLTRAVALAGDERTTRVARPSSTSDETIAMVVPVLARESARVGGRWGDWRVLVGAVLAAALVLWLVVAVTSPSSPRATTTTTTGLTSTQALATFLGDVASVQAAGSLSSASAQSLAQFADLSLSNATAGNLAGAQSDLQRCASLVATERQGGLITTLQAAMLQHALVTLAHSLHLDAPRATPSTTTTTTTSIGPGPPSGPGPGKGKGPGNGNGN